MAYSIVFSLPPAVRTLMEDAATLAGVNVLTGPRVITAGGKSLAVQDIRATASRPITGGYRREEGTFNLRVYVEVKGAGEDAIDAARTDADAVLHAACDVLEADPTVGGILRLCDVTEIAEDDQALIADGHTFAAHAAVSFTADVMPGV